MERRGGGSGHGLGAVHAVALADMLIWFTPCMPFMGRSTKMLNDDRADSMCPQAHAGRATVANRTRQAPSGKKRK